MSLPIGQLVCGGFQGTTVNPQAYHLIVQHKVSLMILLKKNFLLVKQITKLIRDLQYIAMTQGSYEHPLMFAVDEEGGMMNSLFDPDYLTQFPGAMALAATGDTEIIYEILKAMARELKFIGFLILLGPVLDVVTKLLHQLVGVRLFGTTVEDVVKYGRACCKGLQDGGMFTFGKHFPGIGNASVDSLLELPMLAELLDQIRLLNAVPFGTLIKEDLLDGVSAGGCAVPIIAPDEVHACLLPVLISQLLRGELGFDGLVISECLEMDALFHLIGLGQGVIRAIFAGCDLVMVCHNLKLQNEAVDLLHKALANGSLETKVVMKLLLRLRKLQTKLPSWSQMFPEGEKLARADPPLFREYFTDQWNSHQKLLELSYQKLVTMVRDTGIFPITQFLDKSLPPEKNNVLLLTPLLNPLYKKNDLGNDGPRLYKGEDVFKNFGEMLAKHHINDDEHYNVLHTTYTANGLTLLHELLVENSKVVIVLTSEALRNMYQIGIVKYILILCGANPYLLLKNSSMERLAKPLVIVATLLPYDFFYNKSIGSSYLCCYDYTDNVLTQLTKVLMGDIISEGCIPGEKKFVLKRKKRTVDGHLITGAEDSSSSSSPVSVKKTIKKVNSAPKRRWLVEEFDVQRDLNAFLELWLNNESSKRGPLGSLVNGQTRYGGSCLQDSYSFKLLYLLLRSTKDSQKHFVVRNLLLNILYGVILTWVDEHQDTPTGRDLEFKPKDKCGNIVYILVDKSKRLQSIGKNLHATAIKYLTKEKNCTDIALGCSFPMILLPRPEQSAFEAPFFNAVGWDVNEQDLSKKHIMILRNLSSWLVPKKIFRELMVVGVRFDICQNPEKLIQLIDKIGNSTDDPDSFRAVKSLYMEAIKFLNNSSVNGVKIIIALEPTNQNVIGLIILFSNICPLAKFFPFLCDASEAATGKTDGDNNPIAGIIGPIIDPLYLTLAEIFKFGLICSGITFLKLSSGDENNKINSCVMIGVEEDSSNSIKGIKEIGFEEWELYYDYYDRKSDVSVLVSR